MSPAIGLHILFPFRGNVHAIRLMPSEIRIVRPPRVCDSFENAINVAITGSF